MLVTDTTWAELNPVRRALVKPYQAWRCVAWTDEVLNFLIVATREMAGRENLPDGWLVGGPEALMDAASQMESSAFSVYVMDRPQGGSRMNLCQVTGIWREQGCEIPIYWYRTTAGEFRPTSRVWGEFGAVPELTNVMTFDGDLGHAL